VEQPKAESRPQTGVAGQAKPQQVQQNKQANAEQKAESRPQPKAESQPSYDSNVRKDNIQPLPSAGNTKSATPKVENNKKKEKEKTPQRSVRKIKANRAEKAGDEPEVSAPAYHPAPDQPKPKPVEQPKAEPRPQPKAESRPQTGVAGQAKPQQVQQNKQANAEQKAEITAKPVENNTRASTGTRRTRVRSRTVNNEPVNIDEPVDSGYGALD
jgi:ribonuclease E